MIVQGSIPCDYQDKDKRSKSGRHNDTDSLRFKIINLYHTSIHKTLCKSLQLYLIVIYIHKYFNYTDINYKTVSILIQSGFIEC